MTVVDGACAPAKLPRVLEEILRVLGGLAARAVPEEELVRVQRRHRMTLAFSLDSAAELAGWFGSGEVVCAPEGFEERCRRVEGVTPGGRPAGRAGDLPAPERDRRGGRAGAPARADRGRAAPRDDDRHPGLKVDALPRRRDLAWTSTRVALARLQRPRERPPAVARRRARC